MKTKFFLVLFLFLSYTCFSQRESNFRDQSISLDKNNLSARNLLEILNNVENLSVVFNASGEFLDNRIYLESKQSTVTEILDQLCDQIPYEYSFKDNYIILKKRELKPMVKLYGKVLEKESHHPVIAANIYIPEVRKGKVSEADGSYSFELKPGKYTLICTFVGYKAFEEKITLFKDTNIDIYLEQLPQEIGEVEIISRRTEPEDRINVARNIETLDEEDLNQLNTNIATDVFQGRITGLWSTKMSGAPGEHQKIHIRGINSLFASTDPLFVIDGLPVPNVNLNTLGIADLNVRDIEEIKVFKDASSTAYYGYQGANGVILIETKKGGENQIRFSTKHGIQQFNERYNLMQTKEFLNTFRMTDSLYYPRNHKFFKDYTGFYTYIDSMKQRVTVKVDTQRYVYPKWHDSLNLDSYDYQDALFTRGIVNEYHLDASGSLKGINYYISGNLFDHKGVVRNTSYRRYNLTSNLGKKFKNGIELGLSYRGSKQMNRNNLDNYLGNEGILKAINIEPEYASLSPFYRQLFRNYLPAGDPSNIVNMDMYKVKEMFPYYHESVPNFYIGNLDDPLNFFRRDKQLHTLIIHNLSGKFSYEILPGLIFNAEGSLSARDNVYKSSLMKISDNGHSSDSLYLKSNENYTIMNQAYSLGYTKALGHHSFHLAGTYRNYTDYLNWNVDSARNIELDALDKTNSGYIKGSNAIYGEKGDIMRSIRSVIAHFRYEFDKKYSFSGFVNLDHLEEGDNINVTDVFSSVAFNWNVWKELGSFRPDWLSGMDLSANWGQSGNYPLNGLSNDLFADVLADIKLDKINGVYISNLANHYLRHEELSERNIGADISFFNNRIIFTADFFLKKNRNLIVERDIPYYYGGGKFMYNIGELENRGHELSLEVTAFNSNLFSWVTRFGYSCNNQVVTTISDMYDTLLYNNENIFIPDFEVGINSPLGVIKGYRYEGRWTEADDTSDNKLYLENNGMKYFNADSSDNSLTRADKVVIGNSIPDFSLFWNHTIKIKNLRIDFLWYAVAGVDKFNATKASTFYTGRHSTIGEFIADTLNPHMDNVFYESSYFIEDASFIRLKNLNLTYTPEKNLFGEIKTSFSISVENLVTISRYKGYDPESSIYTDNNFSDHAVDFGAYPSPRGIYFGIDLIF